MLAVPSLNECPDVEVMQDLDQQVLVKRGEMTCLQDEFLEARAKYQTILRRVKEETVEVNDLVANRDAAYINYLESSVRTYLPMDGDGLLDSPSSEHAGRGSWMDSVSAGSGMILGGLSSAPVAASAASGWLSASLSSKNCYLPCISSILTDVLYCTLLYFCSGV